MTDNGKLPIEIVPDDSIGSYPLPAEEIRHRLYDFFWGPLPLGMEKLAHLPDVDAGWEGLLASGAADPNRAQSPIQSLLNAADEQIEVTGLDARSTGIDHGPIPIPGDE